MVELTAVPSVADPPAARLRRSGLSRDVILQAATRYIDDHGLARLTMRRLGAELGVEAMALYRYVPSREELLDGVAGGLIEDLLDDPRLVVEPPAWQAYLQELAHVVREVALAHPQVFPIVATRPPAAPWLRPPLRSLRFVEAFLAALDACGFPDGAMVSTYRAFSTFLLGHLMLEVNALGADSDEPVHPAGSSEPDGLRHYSHVLRLSPSLAVDRGLEEFEESLESLLDRIQTTIRSA